jgi:hypothetical protein
MLPAQSLFWRAIMLGGSQGRFFLSTQAQLRQWELVCRRVQVSMGELRTRCNLRACARVWSLEGVASAGTDQPAPPLHSEGVAVRYQYSFRIPTVRPSQNMSLKAKSVCGAENTRNRAMTRMAPIGAFPGSPTQGTITDCASSTLLFLNLIVLVYTVSKHLSVEL